MVEVRFINDTTPIEVTSDEQETQIGVVSETQTTEIQLGGFVEDKHFVYEQSIASDTWHIVHTLNKRASCVAVDSAGEVQIPDKIKYISDNEIVATFLAPFAGKAYLN